jgi:hypothetical protein
MGTGLRISWPRHDGNISLCVGGGRDVPGRPRFRGKHPGKAPRLLVGDVTGDGKADIVRFPGPSPTQIVIQGLSPQVSTPGAPAHSGEHLSMTTPVSRAASKAGNRPCHDGMAHSGMRPDGPPCSRTPRNPGQPMPRVSKVTSTGGATSQPTSGWRMCPGDSLPAAGGRRPAATT